jgi:tRNA 5-methylaminomethyl-2-thiouridine biosynthesis bifunctional protein
LETGELSGLWLCAGMGSRGLSFSMLCAELLAARWGAEPWPLEVGLARSLDALRG